MLPYEAFIGLRYLKAKRRSSVVSIITLISITGVTLGVTALIVVLSVMGGFKKDLKQKILGTKAHIVVRGPTDEAPLAASSSVAERARKVPGVVGASPFIESDVMISSPAGLSGVVLRGILPDQIGQVSNLPREIVKGRLDFLLDDSGLKKLVEQEQDRELDDLLKRLKQERRERDKHRDDAGKGAGKTNNGASPDDAKTITASFSARSPEEIRAAAEAAKKRQAEAKAADDKGAPTAIKPVFEKLSAGEDTEDTSIPLPDDAAIKELKALGLDLPGLDERRGDLNKKPSVTLKEAEDIPELPGGMDGTMPSMTEGSSPELLGSGPPKPKPSVTLGEADDVPALPGESDGGMPPIVGDPTDTLPSSGMPPIIDDPGKKPRLPGLIIGPELAKSLQVRLGDEVNVVTPNGDLGPLGRMPRSRPFRIVGIFYTGMYEFDANFAYTAFDDAKDLLTVEGASGVEIKTVDVEQAIQIAADVRVALGKGVRVLDWMELNRSLFYALKLEKIAMFIVLTFIILVASFSIIAMLIMIVIEKAREVAVLKSLGATNQSVMWMFIFQGTVIGAVGSIAGLGLGLLICWLLMTYGFPLDSEVYYISTLPVDVNPWEVAAVVGASVTISMLATIYPSLLAARLNPVDGLRDD